MPSHRLLRCLGLVGLLLMLEGLGESRAALRAEDENLSSWPQGLVLIVGVPRQVLAEGIEAQVRGSVEPAADGAQVVESGAAEAQVRKSRVEGLAGEGLEVTLSQAEVAASELSDATREPSANPTVIPSRYSERPTVGLRRGWGVVLGGEPKSVLIASHLVLGASDWRWEAWRRDASGWIGTSVLTRSVTGLHFGWSRTARMECPREIFRGLEKVRLVAAMSREVRTKFRLPNHRQ